MAALLLQTAIISFVLFETSFCLSGHLETVYGKRCHISLVLIYRNLLQNRGMLVCKT